MKWYTTSKPSDSQRLICDEETGQNIAVCYDSRHAVLLAAAPALHASLTEMVHLFALEQRDAMAWVQYRKALGAVYDISESLALLDT